MVSDVPFLSLTGVGREPTSDLTALLSRDGRGGGGAFTLVFPQQTADLSPRWSSRTAPGFRKWLYLNGDQYTDQRKLR